MAVLAIDLSAPVELNLTLRGASGGTLRVAVTINGAVVDISAAAIKYYAALSTPIEKVVGTGIAITDGPNGVFEIYFYDTDTIGQNKNQLVFHECKLELTANMPLPVFEGRIRLEKSTFTDMT